MTRIKVKEIIFDSWNIKHISKHNIRAEEVIESGKNLIYHRVTYRGRYLAIGRSVNRLITLILKRQKTTSYYLITARDSSKKERKKVYEKEYKK